MGQLRDIVVSSNGEKVELFVNGVSKGYKLLDESNFHSVTFNNVPVEKGTISAVATRDGITVRNDIVLAGRPAKIILTGSHKKIVADRGSVVVIKADILDSWGNHVYGANNTVKWTISGPATFAGPSVYESDINRSAQMDGAWYIDMPVSNVIRSTGKPGKIQITLSASGLASGTIDIDAEESSSAGTAIAEPVLRDEGRMTMSRLIFNSSRVEEVPREINLAFDEFKLGDSDKTGYAKAIRDYIKQNNQSVDTTSIEFRTLTDILANQLLNSAGHMIADDYNFSVDHYNNTRVISGYINSTKLPQPFKDGLKKYYSETIIRKGGVKDAGEEMNWLNWIPSGGTVVIVQDEKIIPGNKSIIYTNTPELEQIIKAVYPQFVKFSQEAKERALVFISKANPYVHVTPASDQSKVSYTAEKGQPILIPLLKFISE